MQLTLHPESPRSPAEAIEVLAMHLPDGRLTLVYSVTGNIAQIAVPEPHEALRLDGLWRHTCFEAFVRVPGDQAYYEFNLSPSGAWAAYRFDSPRAGMADVDLPAPIIRCAESPFQFGLVAGIDLSLLTELPSTRNWRAALSAVIEAKDGSLSYWALAHPEGQPDFHHDSCFAADLPPIAPA